MGSQSSRAFALPVFARLPAAFQADQQADGERNRQALKQFDSTIGALSPCSRLAVSGSYRQPLTMAKINYRSRRFPPEITQQAIWLSARSSCPIVYA